MAFYNWAWILGLIFLINFHANAKTPGPLGLRTPVGISAAIDTSVSPVGTGAFVTLIAATFNNFSGILVSNSGDKPLALGSGGSPNERDLGIIIPPGSEGIFIPLNGGQGIRMSVRSKIGTQNSGIVTISFFQ